MVCCGKVVDPGHGTTVGLKTFAFCSFAILWPMVSGRCTERVAGVAYSTPKTQDPNGSFTPQATIQQRPLPMGSANIDKNGKS